jgi:hypothetical protein
MNLRRLGVDEGIILKYMLKNFAMWRRVIIPPPKPCES